MHRLSLTLTTLIVVLAGTAGPAKAGQGGGAYTDIVVSPALSSGAYTDDGGAGSTAENDGRPALRAGRRRARPIRCTYDRLAPDDQATAERNWGPSPGGEPGTWGRRICTTAPGRSDATIVWLPRRVDPPVLAERAERYLPLPAPSVSTSPPADDLLVVGLETWLWVDSAAWRPLSSTVSVSGVSVTLSAVPERVIWQTGDGQTVVCQGPGRPYDPTVPEARQHTDCSHVFRTTSAREPDLSFEITATTEWRVAWTAVGAPGGGDLGVVRRSSPPVSVRVGEVQAVNVRPERRR